jgi:hypothetical protein
MNEKELEQISRVVVIDHRNELIGPSLAYTSGIDDNMEVEISVQDDGRTMKIFIGDREPRPKPSNLKVLKKVLKDTLSYQEYCRIMTEYSGLCDFDAEEY